MRLLLFQVKNIVTPRIITVIIVCIFIIFKLSDIPVYVVNRLGIKFSPLKNKTLVGIIFQDDKEVVERVTFLIINFVIPFGAFMIVTICAVILSTQLRRSTEWRQIAPIDAKNDKISSRNLKVAKMVVTIAILFIACFTPITIVMLAIAFVPAMSLSGRYVQVSIILGEVTFILEGINSSMNIFIYHHMSSKYRDTFKQLCSGNKMHGY